jgi:phosphoribosyl 1,2-cyclic phosphodiesterase
MVGSDFLVRFWGVRGSIAVPGPATARYGGNTSSLEVRCGSQIVLLDAGTGLRNLGNRMQAEPPVNADLFFTHSHFDHVCGLPFFKPFFQPESRFRLWAGHLGGTKTLHQLMREFMVAPLFPVPPEAFRAAMEYRDFKAGDTLQTGKVSLRTAELNHPDGATGYRLEFGGKALCYVTDTEHTPGKPDQTVLALIKGADLVIYDSMYTDAEYPSYVGWGHSTWQEGVRLCKAAGAKRLVAFHHDPEHDDEQMDAIARELEAAMPGAVVAREGLELAI